jgi:hypothetical protein
MHASRCSPWNQRPGLIALVSIINHLARMSASSDSDLSNVKQEPRLSSNPYLQQVDDIRSAVINEFDALLATPAVLRELNAAIKPLWNEASKSVRVKKIGNQYHSRIMMIEFEHSAAVKDHVEKLVKSKGRDKEQKRTDLLEGLILLKQLKHYSLNRPEFSPTGCCPAWYQQIFGGSADSSGIAEELTVADNNTNEDDIIDIDTLDKSSQAVTVAAAPVNFEQS